MGLLLGLVVTGYTFAHVFAFGPATGDSKRMTEELATVSAYMKAYNFPRHLRLKIMKCHRQHFEEQTTLMQGDVLSRLTPQLHEEVSAFLASDIIYKCPLFVGVDA